MQLLMTSPGFAGIFSFLLDFVAGVHDRGMVALEYFSDIGEGIFQFLPDHVHGHLAGIGDVLERFCEIICSTGM